MVSFEIEKKLARLNGTLDLLYEKKVVSRIRKKYSPSAENAILRKYMSNPQEHAAEFEEYDTYAEQCKAEARLEVYGKEGG